MSLRLALAGGIAISALIATSALADVDRSLQIVVSKDQQVLNVYDGSDIVATTRVSTGKPGHTTPSGIFSILEKQKFHRSNKYSNAPMPWMQRITWSGVALHESNSVPSFPASHGCVRMPAAFARQLYGMTARGVNVVIADAPVAPEKLEGQSLFLPQASPQSPTFMNDVAMRPTLKTDGKTAVEVAMNDARATPELDVVEEKRNPIHILITRAEKHNDLSDIQFMLNQLGYGAGTEDGLMGGLTRAAIDKFKLDNGLPTDGEAVSEGFITLIYGKSNRALPQNGLLIVRQNFAEVYRAPVTIEKPEVALGTHFMVARHVSPNDKTAEWFGMNLDNHIPDAARKRLGITADADASDTPVAALDRISMSTDTRARVGQMLADGSSLTITDVESKSETGLGTNFVTITRPSPVR